MYLNGDMYLGEWQCDKKKKLQVEHGFGATYNRRPEKCKGKVYIGHWVAGLCRGMGKSFWLRSAPSWTNNKFPASEIKQRDPSGKEVSRPYLYIGGYVRNKKADPNGMALLKDVTSRTGPWRQGLPVGDWWEEHRSVASAIPTASGEESQERPKNYLVRATTESVRIKHEQEAHGGGRQVASTASTVPLTLAQPQEQAPFHQQTKTDAQVDMHSKAIKGGEPNRRAVPSNVREDPMAMSEGRVRREADRVAKKAKHSNDDRDGENNPLEAQVEEQFLEEDTEEKHVLDGEGTGSGAGDEQHESDDILPPAVIVANVPVEALTSAAPLSEVDTINTSLHHWLQDEAIGNGACPAEMKHYAEQLFGLGLHSKGAIVKFCTAQD
jgi:hypothetical protein